MTSGQNTSKPEEPKEAKSTTSKGERWFDRITYGGVAGVATFLLSLPMGFAARYTVRGKGAITWLARNFEKVGLSENVATNAAMTTALMQGGNITVVPVKMLEDRKPELVAKLNRTLGDDSGDLSVKDEPKQTWGSLFKARILLAWMPVFASLQGASMLLGKNADGKKRFDVFEEKFAEHVVCKPLGQPMTYEAIEEGKKVIKETRAYRYGKIAAIDLFATAAAAALLYVGSRIFARKGKEKTVEETTPATPSEFPLEPPADGKLFANIIGTKPRGESFAQSVAAQKTDRSLELGA
jgi:hypothetical protein